MIRRLGVADTLDRLCPIRSVTSRPRLQRGVHSEVVSGYAKGRAHERIRVASRAGLHVATFLDEASAALASAVPNENHLNGPYWYTLDPGFRLITSTYGGAGRELDTSEVMRWEYLDDEVNK